MAGKGRRGPAPKPSAKKKLQGNPGKRKMNAAEPTFEPLADFTPPRWLKTDKEAAGYWTRMAPSLVDEGVLTVADQPAFEALCKSYSRWRAAERELDLEGSLVSTTPNGYEQQSPLVTIVDKTLSRFQSLAGEFGLTPSSRSRVTKEDKEPTDPFEAYLNGPGTKKKTSTHRRAHA